MNLEKSISLDWETEYDSKCNELRRQMASLNQEQLTTVAGKPSRQGDRRPINFAWKLLKEGDTAIPTKNETDSVTANEIESFEEDRNVVDLPQEPSLGNSLSSSISSTLQRSVGFVEEDKAINKDIQPEVLTVTESTTSPKLNAMKSRGKFYGNTEYRDNFIPANSVIGLQWVRFAPLNFDFSADLIINFITDRFLLSHMNS